MRRRNRFTLSSHPIISPGEHGGIAIGNLCAENPDLTVFCVMANGRWHVRECSESFARFAHEELSMLANQAIEAWQAMQHDDGAVLSRVLSYQIAVHPKVLHDQKPLAKTWQCVMVDIIGPGVGNYLPFCCQELMRIAVEADTVRIHKHCNDQIILSAFIEAMVGCDCIPRVYSVLTPHTIAARMLAA